MLTMQDPQWIKPDPQSVGFAKLQGEKNLMKVNDRITSEVNEYPLGPEDTRERDTRDSLLTKLISLPSTY